jgi:hypothetical protein
VVNGKLFRTVAQDEGKTTQNSDVRVSTVDGDTYYGKLTQIIEVKYYDTTRYVLFKCDWANIRKDRKWSEDEYGITLVNFKNLIHTGDKISDDLYVLSSQVSQVYYIHDDRNPDSCCIVRTKLRNVYDVGQGEGNNDDGLNYHESEPLNLNVNRDPNDVDYLDVQCARTDIPAIEVVQPQ